MVMCVWWWEIWQRISNNHAPGLPLCTLCPIPVLYAVSILRWIAEDVPQYVRALVFPVPAAQLEHQHEHLHALQFVDHLGSCFTQHICGILITQ